MTEFVDDDDFGSPFEEFEARLDELAMRVDELDARPASAAGSAVSGGYCVGAALATVLSWDMNHAIGWAAMHGILSWIYVVYDVVTRWAMVKVF
jgi:hypothetical protein